MTTLALPLVLPHSLIIFWQPSVFALSVLISFLMRLSQVTDNIKQSRNPLTGRPELLGFIYFCLQPWSYKMATVGICSFRFDFLPNANFPDDRQYKAVPEPIPTGRPELLGLIYFCLQPWSYKMATTRNSTGFSRVCKSAKCDY